MRSNSRRYLIVTLRHNIGIESDVKLALDEFSAICSLPSSKSIRQIESAEELSAILRNLEVNNQASRLLTHNLRQDGAVAFAIEGVTAKQFEAVLKNCAFGQEVLYLSSQQVQIDDLLCKKLSREFVVSEKGIGVRGITLSSLLDYSTKMVSNRMAGGNVSVALDALVDYLLDEIEPRNGMLAAIRGALDAKKTTLYLTHELHLYKGKFFPRMVRSLMNRFLVKPNSLVVDPFAGSGTALLEASLLGHASIGIDVDPTSVLISSQKLTPKDIDPIAMQDACVAIYDAVNGNEETLFTTSHYSLGGWEKFKVDAPEPMRSRLIKRGNEEGYDLLGEVENDSAKALCLISQLPVEIQPIMRVCLSHALTKKLRLRFVGIGNGRFTIDVAKAGVLDMFVKKAFHIVAINEIFFWLKRYGMEFPVAEVIRGSAKDFHRLLGGRKADLILTSPPYIPASSGREHYARARAIPLVFTGAATLEELDHLDEAFIGEMSAQTDTLHLEQAMPPAIKRTLTFLREDKQRLPKYLPTLNYYVDLEKVLINTRQSLSDKGKALFVVASAHTFYIHKTKEILHTVDAVTAISELGVKAGLKLEEVIHIPLKKSGGLNARPRSTDEYSESVVVFSRYDSKS
ncbi:MAG: DNA methyltransferase [Gallionella sp.]|nr:DNA methyltransferase [Gallionella sp.]